MAASAEKALALAVAKPPALVIMDVRLRGRRDGIDAALELFSRHGIRVVFATAHDDGSVRRRARPASPLAWLPKPYSMASLVATLLAPAMVDRGDGVIINIGSITGLRGSAG